MSPEPKIMVIFVSTLHNKIYRVIVILKFDDFSPCGPFY